MSIFFDDDFESANGTTIPNWSYAFGPNTATRGLTASTDVALTGSRSIKVVGDTLDGQFTGLLTLERFFTDTQHFFLRFGFRLNAGFQISSNSFSKALRIGGSVYGPDFYIEQATMCGGGYELTLENMYDNASVGITNFCLGAMPSIAGFDQIELEWKFNTAGNSDGYVKVWLTRPGQPQAQTPILQILNRQFLGPLTTSTLPSGASVASNFTMNILDLVIQGGIGTYYFDRVAVGDGSARIGTVGSVVDTMPPAAPTGLVVS